MYLSFWETPLQTCFMITFSKFGSKLSNPGKQSCLISSIAMIYQVGGLTKYHKKYRQVKLKVFRAYIRGLIFFFFILLCFAIMQFYIGCEITPRASISQKPCSNIKKGRFDYFSLNRSPECVKGTADFCQIYDFYFRRIYNSSTENPNDKCPIQTFQCFRQYLQQLESFLKCVEFSNFLCCFSEQVTLNKSAVKFVFFFTVSASDLGFHYSSYAKLNADFIFGKKSLRH